MVWGVAHPMGSESKQAVDTTTQTRAESLLAAAKRTLGMIAGSPSLTDILENLCGAIALYLNVFVLIVRLFEKVPGLKAMAPALSEPPFKAFRAGDFRPAWHFRRKVVRQRTSPYGLTHRIGFSRWVRGLAPN
jgi:hypothetical protein